MTVARIRNAIVPWIWGDTNAQAINLVFAISIFATAQSNAQGVFKPGDYKRSVPDGVATLGVSETPSGNNILYHQNAPYSSVGICQVKGRIDINVTFDAPKNYEMDTPLAGAGTCTIMPFETNCSEVKCTVRPVQMKFRQASDTTIVLTGQANDKYTFKMGAKGRGTLDVGVDNIMKPARSSKRAD